MAGKTVSQEAAKANDIVLCWMFDYICYRVWEQFSSNASIAEADKDIIQGLSGLLNKLETYPSKDCIRQKYLLMVNICRLDDGEDITSHYDPDSDETPLESMLTTFTSLVELQDQEVKKEGKKLLSTIKSEAVLVCCRAGEFDMAKSVLTALWNPAKLDSEEKKTRQLLKPMVEERSKDFKNYSYSNFIDTMKKYLEKIYSRFQKPLLLEAAEKRLSEDREMFEREKDALAGRKRKLGDKNLSSEALNGCKEADQSTSNKRNDDSGKLRKLWSKNNGQLFEQDDPPRVSSQLSEESVPALRINEKNNNATVSKPQKSSSKRKEPDKLNEEEEGSEVLMPAPSQPLSRRPIHKMTSQAASRTREDSPTSTSTNEDPRTSTPQKQKQPSGSGENMMYRKNIGRPNRHEPEKKTKTGTPKKTWDEMSANFSFISSATARTKWTDEETEEFFKAVTMIGVGKWREIRDYLGTTRTNVMLKDKWRNMIQSGEANRYSKMLRGNKK